MYSFMQPPDPPEEDEGERYERHVLAEFNTWWMSGTYPMRKCDRFIAENVSEDSAQEIWFASREPALGSSQVLNEGKNQANAWRIIDRKGKRHTVYHEGLAQAIAELGLTVTPMCDVPPSGWECSRDKGHDGPCAATEATE